MILSMTSYGLGNAISDAGELSIEIKSVNNRYLDIHMRIPDEIRFLENLLREQIAMHIRRGKIDVRVSYEKTNNKDQNVIDSDYLNSLAKQLAEARKVIPDIYAPRLTDILNHSNSSNTLPNKEIWTHLCEQALTQAISQLIEGKQREGSRLADALKNCLHEMDKIVKQTESVLPILMKAHHDKIVSRLQEVLADVCPDGLHNISGEELSARIAQEAALFSIRSDVEEELTRLRSHMNECMGIITASESNEKKRTNNRRTSTGKRLDFLCQELNREANTLGSKAAGLEISNAAIDLKLLIEQLREQAQNIE